MFHAQKNHRSQCSNPHWTEKEPEVVIGLFRAASVGGQLDVSPGHPDVEAGGLTTPLSCLPGHLYIRGIEDDASVSIVTVSEAPRQSANQLSSPTDLSKPCDGGMMLSCLAGAVLSFQPRKDEYFKCCLPTYACF